MSTLTKKLRITLTLLLVLAMLVPLFQSVKVFAAYETVWFESFESGTSADGWSTPYGGTITRSTDFSAMGDYSLKITGRTKAWQSPAKNIYQTIRENGAGKYTISMKVLTTAVNPEIPKIGTLIRTTKENSFSKYHSGNYFYRLVGKYGGVTANTWFTLSGTVDILDSDISAETGLFRLMFDILEPVDGQAVYIDDIRIERYTEPDDFEIDKTSGFLYIGETMKINTNKEYGIGFYSSNKNVATVNNKGEVTAVSAGQTTIHVTHGSQKRYCTVTVDPKYHVLADGMYLVRNTDKGIFMQVPADDIANENAAVNLLEYNGGTQQHWEIAYAGSGYYKIVNRRSGKVLSVQDNSANTDNKNLVQKTYTSANEQKWQIIPLGDGNYKFKPKSGEDYSSDWCAAANGNKVQQRQFVESGTNKYIGEWTLFDMNKPAAIIEPCYDIGYKNRYSDYDSKAQENILSIQRKYLADFGVYVMSEEIIEMQSLADNCNSGSYTSACRHANNANCEDYGVNDTNPYHHKSIINMIRHRGISTAGNRRVRIIFTGHNTCGLTFNDKVVFHEIGGYNGLTLYYNNSILNGTAAISNHSTVYSQKQTTVHEFGHFFRALDHYGGTEKSTIDLQLEYPGAGYSPTCIYGEERIDTSVMQNMTICDGCKSAIRSGINTLK